VIEAINKVGSALYGPTLGVFLLAIFRNRTTATGVNIGLIVGMLFNLYLWLFQPQIFWMWWNFIGLVVTVGIALLVSVVHKANQGSTRSSGETLAFSKRELLTTGSLLVGFFVLIVVLSYFIGVVGKGLLI
jgi:Na+/proline symporter